MAPDMLEKWRKFAACMRANGVDMPDPDPNDSRPKLPEEPATPRDNSAHAQSANTQADRAWEECAKQVPGVGLTVSNEGDGKK